MKTVSRQARPAPESEYMELVRRFPLRRIRSAAENRAALKIVDELMARGEDALTEGEADYLEALARFIGDWEREHLLSKLGEATPREVLRHLMESRAMTPAQLGDILGSRSAATMILKGQREMSKSHIRALASHFGVSAGVFV